MAKTFNRMRIDVNEKPNSIGINPVQNDTQSRYLDVSLYDNGLPIDLTGEVVRINFKKEDGTTFFNQGEVTNAAEGRCQFALTNEVLSDAKEVKAQISIWGGEGQILSTQVFTIFVTESIRNDEEVESTNEFGVLVVLFQEIQNSLDLMKAIAENFGEPGEKAEEFGAETFWQMLEVLAGRADTENILKKYIKLVLNSTMDTEVPLPLDEMIESSKTSLANIISPIETKVDAINTASIRHIQRGYVDTSGSSTITLNGFTNLSKMIVLLNGSGYKRPDSGTSSYAYATTPYVSALSTSALTLRGGYSYADKDYSVSYQVIEFY